MAARGQVERRVDAVIYELKPAVEWVVDDGGALFQVLRDACVQGQITNSELEEACTQVVEFKFDHRRLASLSKRVPAINDLRRRVEGESKLRQKR